MSKTALMLGAASIAAIAATCHAANAAFCRSLGDDSQPEWDNAPDWQRDSAINGVSFHLANPDAGDSASHENWMAVKGADGWVFGEAKDPEKKTHPCMVPFDQLPKEQQFKDALFRTLVHSLAPGFASMEELAAAGSEASDKAERLESELGALKAELVKAKAAPKAARAPARKKARAVGPLAEGKGIDGISPADLLELIREADEVEIAFSDGKKEIEGLPALEISGEAWAVRAHGLALQLPELTVNGPAPGKPAFPLAGYGLLLDGEQVLWQARPDVLQIGPGHQYNLKDDIIFAG